MPNTSLDSTTSSNCLTEYAEVVFGVPETVFWVLVGIATVAGNSISIYKLLKSKRRWHNHNIYLVSLLSTDLIIGATLHPIAAMVAYTNSTTCGSARAVRGFAYFNLLVSLLSSLSIAVNRYKALDVQKTRSLNRMQSNNATKSKTPFVVVAAIWLFTIFATSLIVATNQTFLRLQLLIPLLLITVVFVYIVVAIKLKAVFRKINPSFLRRSSQFKQHSSSVRLIQLIVLNMLMTSLPAIIIRSLRARMYISMTVVSVANKIYMLSPMLDPLCFVLVKHASY